MMSQAAQSPSSPAASTVHHSETSVEQIQLKLVELLHEMQQGGTLPIKHLRESMRFVQKALTLLGDPDDMSEVGPVDWAAFSARLRERRLVAKLSQEQLATKVSVSSTTIRNIESQRKRPGRGLMLKLLSVPELDFRVSDIELNADLPLGTTWTPTSWFAPKYDPVAMMADMHQVLNGNGGQVEQTLLYFDPQSAADWLATCSSTEYIATYRTGQPFPAIAKRVARRIGSQHLIVNGLGCGDGKNEIALVHHLLRCLPPAAKPDVYLLDISHTLLNAAHKHAGDELSQLRVLTVHGNFHELPRYTMLAQLRGQRLYTTVGGTLVNLSDEVRFFRDTMSCCVPGDLFLCDILIANASPDRPDEIRRVDAALTRKVRPSHAAWLGGPLRRYCRGMMDVEFHLELDTRCPVPGSYGLDFIATIKMQSGIPDRRFLMWKTRRYAPKKLAETLDGVGWHPELIVPYGQDSDGKPTMALMLFRKR